MNAKRNDPCPCGSGVHYKFCHQPIVEAPPHKVLEVGREQYARAWASNAAHYQSQGCYTYLASEVLRHQPARVLDIGCGLGHGLKALTIGMSPGGRFLMGLDENPRCLASACDLLKSAGIDVATIERIESIHVPGTRDYDLVYSCPYRKLDSSVVPTENSI